MKKILVIIPTYNPTDDVNTLGVWKRTITGAVRQRNIELYVDIVIADNCSGQNSLKFLKNISEQLNCSFIHLSEYYTGFFIPFNIVMMKYAQNHDYYVYCASDVIFENDNDLGVLINDMPEDCSVISPQLTSDTVQRLIYNTKKPPTLMQLGDVINGHLYVFTRHFMESYDYKYTDIFYSSGTEEIIPYQCAAIGKKMYLSHKVLLTHIGKVDRKTRPSSNRITNDFYKRCDIYDIVQGGKDIGFGFRENDIDINLYWNIFFNSNSIKFKVVYLKVMLIKYIKIKFGVDIHPCYLKHNTTKFDKDKLYEYLKEYFYLTPSEFDYSKM